MKQCQCGQSLHLFSFYPVCDDCLQAYFSMLPHRPGVSITQFQLERQQAQQPSAILTRVSAAPRRIRLLDTVLDPVTLAEVMATVECWVDSDRPHQIVTVNVDFVRIAQQNKRFRQIVNTADLSVADGKPLLWAARWTGQHLPARITGMDLVLGAAKLAARRQESMFLLGAADGIATQAAAALEALYPGLEVHTYSPPFGPFTDDENARIIQMIRDSGAKYLFVAFGAPKQDLWIHAHLHELGVPMCVGIGGVFNFLAGAIKRAPTWMQQCGMEWLYRVVQEPRRLWRRYIVEDLPVFLNMLGEPVGVHANHLPQPRYPVVMGQEPAYEHMVVVRHNIEQAVGGS